MNPELDITAVHGNNGNGIIAHSAKYQIWACAVCTQERHWGFFEPEFGSVFNPLLRCSVCARPTRHYYTRIVFNRPFGLIDFGKFWQLRGGAD